MAGLGGCVDESVSGVADSWHSGVGDEEDLFACGDGVEDLGDAAGFVVFVAAEGGGVGVDAEVGHESFESAGVFGGDDVGAGECVGESGGGVAGVADGGCGGDETSPEGDVGCGFVFGGGHVLILVVCGSACGVVVLRGRVVVAFVGVELFTMCTPKGRFWAGTA